MADGEQAFLKLMLITKQELCYAMQGRNESLTADKNLQKKVQMECLTYMLFNS